MENYIKIFFVSPKTLLYDSSPKWDMKGSASNGKFSSLLSQNASIISDQAHAVFKELYVILAYNRLPF